MYTRKLLVGARHCTCNNDEITIEEDHEEGTWLVFCGICLGFTDSAPTRDEAVKMWEENNVFGFTGSKPH